ncbi:MAG: hypothetical protein IPJ28_21205 [Betaproteobacteria bacterium]|nr:hypothetical protein [Betaproteobacteria bacterium]
MPASRREVLGLALRALGWLPLTLAAWYFASAALAWVPAKLAAPALGLAGVEVRSVTLADGVAAFGARLVPPYRPGIAQVESVAVDVDVKTRTFTFGIALFVALTLATGRPWRARAVAIGAAVTIALPAWSIAFDALRQLASVAALGPVLAWPPAVREGIAFGYQLGSLLLPTLAPVIAWIALNPRLTRGRA